MGKTFWVIETAQTTYWDGRDVKEKTRFVYDIDEAVKFYDFESAELVRCWLLEEGAHRLRSAEHSYIDNTPQPDSTSGKESTE